VRWIRDERESNRDNKNKGWINGIVIGIRESRYSHSDYFEVCMSIVPPLAPFNYIADIRDVVAFEDEGGALIDDRNAKVLVREYGSESKKGSVEVGFI